MSALALEIDQRYHLNGIEPGEAKALGVEQKVAQRIEQARRVLEAVGWAYPDMVSSVAQIYDFEMRQAKFSAAHKYPVKGGFMGRAMMYLMEQRLMAAHQFRTDGVYSQGVRMSLAEQMIADLPAEEDIIRRQMQANANIRFPPGRSYVGNKTPAQVYHKTGVDITMDRPQAGFFVPFDEGMTGYDISAPEAFGCMYGLLGELVRNRDYSHIFMEMSDLGEQGRGRRFFETPLFTQSRDGHLVAVAHPGDVDNVYGIQFDDPRLLSALTFASLAQTDAAIYQVPRETAGIIHHISSLSDESRAAVVHPF
jgi:hypothetical protein